MLAGSFSIGAFLYSSSYPVWLVLLSTRVNVLLHAFDMPQGSCLNIQSAVAICCQHTGFCHHALIPQSRSGV